MSASGFSFTIFCRSSRRSRTPRCRCGLHGAPRSIQHTVDAPVLSGGYVYWVLHGSLGTSPVRIRRVPVPGANCRHAPIEAATGDLPPVSTGFAVDGTKIYYSNAHGVFEADPPAFVPA